MHLLWTKRHLSLLALGFAASSLVGCASDETVEMTPTPSPSSSAPANLNAPYHASGGYGTSTEGGLAGTVIRVTSLAASGPGSLRAALQTSGPRLVVFEVGGVIDLGLTMLSIVQPNLTIAGQTAPDPGITIIRGGMTISTHDVVIQHIAVRPGDADQPAGSGWEPDGMTVYGETTRPAYNVVFDHCSATWGVDENLSVSGPRDLLLGSNPHFTSHDVTLYRCLIAEGLSHSSHSKGEHSKGTLIHDSVYSVAVLGCLYAHNIERNPRLKGGARAVVVNNVMYDWGGRCVGVGTMGNDVRLIPSEAAVVGNVAIAGPSTSSFFFVYNGDYGAKAYLSDNRLVPRGSATISETNAGVQILSTAPLWPDGLSAGPAAQTYADVLRTAGARPAHRDAIDTRIVDTVIARGGRVIDSQNEVGGYPHPTPTSRSVTVPDSVDARRAWLDELSSQLAVASSLNVPPL